MSAYLRHLAAVKTASYRRLPLILLPVTLFRCLQAVSAVYSGLTCSGLHKSPAKVNVGLTLITICPHAVDKSSLLDVHLFIFPVGMNECLCFC